MFKRILALTLAVALVAALWLVPSIAAAPDMSADKIADFDFSNGKWEDKVGTIEIRGGDSFGFKDSDEVGRKVALIPFDLQLKFYTTPKIRTFSNFTVEFYVKITTDAETDVRLIAVGNDGQGDLGLFERDGEVSFGLPYAHAKMEGRLPRNEWIHVVGVRSANKVELYINGELKAEAPVNHQNNIGGSTDSVYIGSFGQGVDMELANFRMYKAAANAENVAEWYTELTGVTPTETPAPTPTATPTPPTIELPSGEDYKMTADLVPAFKAGDEVRVKININDINEYGLVGLDVFLAYDNTRLEFNKEATDELWANHPLEAEDWFMTSVVDEKDGLPIIDVRMADDSSKGVQADGELYMEVVFTALTDSEETGGMIAYTMRADGALNDASISVAHGTGTYVYTEAVQEEPSESPSEEPSETPSEEPSESPTTEPGDPDVPPTFDAGIISLAAVALSSVVAVKKRKIS